MVNCAGESISAWFFLTNLKLTKLMPDQPRYEQQYLDVNYYSFKGYVAFLYGPNFNRFSSPDCKQSLFQVMLHILFIMLIIVFIILACNTYLDPAYHIVIPVVFINTYDTLLFNSASTWLSEELVFEAHKVVFTWMQAEYEERVAGLSPFSLHH